MTILITGSHGKTASALTEQVASTQPILIASRHPSLDPRLPTVRLDWHDPATYELPFAHPQARRSPIDAAYLVGDPALYQPSPSVLAFVEYARTRGVRRFVLVSAWEVAEGQACLMGLAHAALKRMEAEGVEWTVLRPQFFMDNFAESYSLTSIRDEGKIYSGADEGRVAFVAAADIASVAHRALTDDVAHNTDHIITGGEALTYDEVARIFSEVLGRKIEHKKLTQKEFGAKLAKAGHLSSEMTNYMVGLDDDVACGRGCHTTDTVERILGRKPMTMREFVVAKKELWV